MVTGPSRNPCFSDNHASRETELSMADSEMGSRSEKPGKPRTMEFIGQCTVKRGAQEVTPIVVRI